MENLLMGIKLACTPVGLICCLLATVEGIIVGALPGLGPTIGMSLLIPFTYSMSPATALIFLAACYCGTQYGGSITAILLNTPGTPAAVATTIEGYQMTLNGRGGEALNEAAVASFWGGMVSALAFIFLAPPLARFSVKFGSMENLLLAVFGLAIIASLSEKDMIKGLIGGAFGLALACVGTDPFTATERYTFDSLRLMSGLSPLPVMIGVFSIARIVHNIRDSESTKLQSEKKVEVKHHLLKDLFKYFITYVRSGVIGTIVGIIPGAAGNVSTFIAYDQAKKWSKNPNNFGHGEREGIAATESANNGVTGGAMIPTMTLGIPGSPSMAVFMGALLIQGLQPGYDLFNANNSTIIYPFMVGLIVANVMMLLVGYYFSRHFLAVLKVPSNMLVAGIVVLCVAGVYASGKNMTDIYVMLIFSFVGYAMERFKFSGTPVVLGFILGPLTEKSLLKVIAIYKTPAGILGKMFTSPICIVLLLVIALVIGNAARNSMKEKNAN